MDNYGKGIMKGMAVTLKHLFRHPVTTQYPEQRVTTSRRFRGNELIWVADQCIACSLCARSCPQGVIHIETSVPEQGARKKVTRIWADMGYCIFCGLCVESCARDSLYLGYSYERAKYRRNELVLDEDGLALTDKKQRSGYARPAIARELPPQTLLMDKDHR